MYIATYFYNHSKYGLIYKIVYKKTYFLSEQFLSKKCMTKKENNLSHSNCNRNTINIIIFIAFVDIISFQLIGCIISSNNLISAVSAVQL